MFTTKTGTKWEILEVLREQEELTIDELEEHLDVSSSTLNEHLSDLQAMDLIDKETEKDGPGRPHYLYFLTEEAEHLFPHSYARLASMLLDVIRTLADQPEANQKIAQVMKNHLEEYDDLKTALRTLGFYPEFDDESDQETIIYHQCPFYDVAKKDPSLCEIDQQVLEEVTEKDVEMNDCIATGSKRCEFVLTKN